MLTHFKKFVKGINPDKWIVVVSSSQICQVNKPSR